MLIKKKEISNHSLYKKVDLINVWDLRDIFQDLKTVDKHYVQTPGKETLNICEYRIF
jgi:hypothetical protein